MYFFLLSLHSLLRWLVLISLLYAIYTAYQGASKNLSFTAVANAVRHWAATISHIQLLVGMTIYFQSPIVLFKMADSPDKLLNEQTFFRFVHISLMLLAVVIITVGSAKAKRLSADQDKYRTMLSWFVAALLIILVAIPWPFSPLASRPYLRTI
jgi:multisubunit Na+/H+ antiporter MnhG subunit